MLALASSSGYNSKPYIKQIGPSHRALKVSNGHKALSSAEDTQIYAVSILFMLVYLG